VSTRGQEPLPGATEKLLQATGLRDRRAGRRFAEYHAISITRTQGGAWQAMALTLDPGTGHVVPRLLDRWESPVTLPMSPAEALLYWAQQAVLDERGVLE